MTSRTGGARAHVRLAGAVLLAWTLLALLATSLIVVRSSDAAGWWTTFLYQLPSWWLWGGLTPLVLLASHRWPVRGVHWSSSLAKHILVGVAVVVVYIALEAPFAILREGRVVTAGAWVSAIGGGVAFRFLSHFLTYSGIVAASQAFGATQALRERDLHASRLEAQLNKARLGAIRAQLQPHFLYNTLHAIGGLVRSGESNRAVGMIAGLSGLLRHSLERVHQPLIPLHAEMEALERYLEIEEIRFGDRLEVVRDLDGNTMDVLVPAFILQPLVENAVRHGIEGRAGASLVRIESRLEDGSLVLRITDDGVGVPEGFDPLAQEGVGLRYAAERLDDLYGNGARLRVVPLVGQHGCLAEVRLPTSEAIS